MEGVKGQGDALHIYDHQLLHCVITRAKMFRDMEYATQSNFCCQPVWIVICTMVQFLYDHTKIHRTEPIFTAGSLSCLPCAWLLPCVCFPPIAGCVAVEGAQRKFSVACVLSNGRGER